ADAHRSAQRPGADGRRPPPTTAGDPRAPDSHQPALDAADARPLALADRLHDHPGPDPRAPPAHLTRRSRRPPHQPSRRPHRHAGPCPKPAAITPDTPSNVPIEEQLAVPPTTEPPYTPDRRRPPSPARRIGGFRLNP